MDQPYTENEAVVEQYSKNIRGEALRIKKRGRIQLPLEDMVADGVEGLLLAQRNNKPRDGVQFWSYAKLLVRRTIFDGIRRQRGITQRQYDSIRTEYALRDVHPDSQPTAVPTSEIERDLLAKDLFTDAYARWTGAAAGFALGGIVEADEHKDPETRAAGRERTNLLRAAIAELPERLRLVVELYYLQDLSLVEIAEQLGKDKSVISRNHADAITLLQERLADGG